MGFIHDFWICSIASVIHLIIITHNTTIDSRDTYKTIQSNFTRPPMNPTSHLSPSFFPVLLGASAASPSWPALTQWGSVLTCNIPVCPQQWRVKVGRGGEGLISDSLEMQSSVWGRWQYKWYELEWIILMVWLIRTNVAGHDATNNSQTH